MVWTHQGKEVPLAVYHGVPRGWYAHEIVAEHARLGGTDDISGPEATEPGAPSWMPERREWLQYRETLYRIAEGVRANEPACIELAVRFIELRYIGSYSGFVREKLSRRLRHASLTAEQKERLHRHFQSLVLGGEHTQEFRDYLRLWRQIVTDAGRTEIVAAVRALRGDGAAEWLDARLRPTR